MNYSELRNSTPYNSNTGDVTVIDFPLVRNARGNNDYVTAIDLIQFGKTTDFLKNNQEVTGWESTLNAIDTYFRQLNSAVETLSSRLDTIQTGFRTVATKALTVATFGLVSAEKAAALSTAALLGIFGGAALIITGIVMAVNA